MPVETTFTEIRFPLRSNREASLGCPFPDVIVVVDSTDLGRVGATSSDSYSSCSDSSADSNAASAADAAASAAASFLFALASYCVRFLVFEPTLVALAATTFASTALAFFSVLSLGKPPEPPWNL